VPNSEFENLLCRKAQINTFMSQMDGKQSTFGTDWKCSEGCIVTVHLNLLFWFAHNVIGVFVLCLSDIVQRF